MCAPHIKIKLSMPHIELGDAFFDDALSMNNQVQHICRVVFPYPLYWKNPKSSRSENNTNYDSSRLDNGN